MKLADLFEAKAFAVPHDLSKLDVKQLRALRFALKKDPKNADKVKRVQDAIDKKEQSVDEGLVEAKKVAAPKAPRAKHLHDVMMGRKGGGHYSEKTDYKRAKEKQKLHKEMRDE